MDSTLRKVNPVPGNPKNSTEGAAKLTLLPFSLRAQARAALLAAIILLVYTPVFVAEFVWDDAVLRNNPLLESGKGLWRIWSAPGQLPGEEHYWPVTYTVFWVQHWLWGGNAGLYHAVNLFLHVANSFLIWVLLSRLRIPGGWLAAMLFGVHPIHVESVAWIIELKDVLSGFFYLLGVWGYVHWFQAGSRRAYLGSIVACLAGMLSKSVVVTLPIVLLLLVMGWSGGARRRKALVGIVPFAAVAFGLALLDLLVVHASARAPFYLGWPERLVSVGKAFWFYALKIVAPFRLMAIYPKWSVEPDSWLQFLPLGLFVAAILGAFLMRRKLGNATIAGFLLFVVALLPTIGLLPFSYMQHSFVADRYLYLPSIAPLAMIANALTRAARKPTMPRLLLRYFALSLVFALGALTFLNAQRFQDTVTLFEHNLTLNPKATAGRLALATELIRRGENQRAVHHLSIVVEETPADEIAHYGLAIALWKTGDRLRAIEHLDEALRLRPGYQRARELRERLVVADETTGTLPGPSRQN